MKQELHDIAVQVTKASPGIALTGITLNHIVAIVTILYILLQAAYLIRKWIREETEWGRRLKRWASGKSTQPGDLQ
ncbi:MAG: hypothetical protein IBJ14_05070 [Hydrogenophaga sp.]|nr:hypothetical protein [Hydrogenophaga sp.]